LAVIHDGRIEPLHKITAPEGTRVLVMLLLEDEADFWCEASLLHWTKFGTTQRMIGMPSYSKPELANTSERL